MKFAEYVAWSLLCKHCQFGKKNSLQFHRYQIFLREYFFGGPYTVQSVSWIFEAFFPCRNTKTPVEQVYDLIQLLLQLYSRQVGVGIEMNAPSDTI